jgi:propionyl-CoA synthetase
MKASLTRLARGVSNCSKWRLQPCTASVVASRHVVYARSETELQNDDNVVIVDQERLESIKKQRPSDHIDKHVRSSGAYRRLYEAVYRRSLDNPEEFWGEAAEDIVWFKRWDKVMDDSQSPMTKWFVGGELNTCYNCVDRHVERGFGNQAAIIHDSPVTNTVRTITYKELLSEVAQFASVLSQRGVTKGDRVLIYMPMIPEAIVAMLATARIGAIHSLVFGGFAPKELSTRINHAEPKVIVSANCAIENKKVINYKPLLDQAIEISTWKPQTCVIYNRKNEQFADATLVTGRDFDYHDLMSKAKFHGCVAVSATDPLYLLYTSGTTGTPKAVVRPSGGHAVVLNWSMFTLYGINKHETWFAGSDLGWVVGHSYIVYAPLLHCNTTVLYEGKPVGTPDPGAYYRLLEQHKVVGMFVAPTAMRALRREDPHGLYAANYSIPNFRYIFLAGEHCDQETLHWARDRFQVPCLDHWWQTETGSPISGTCVGLGNELYPDSGVAGKPVPGFNVKVIRNDMTECQPGELGNIVVKLPLPPANFSTLYKAEERFKETYFNKYPGYYDTMDAGFITANGDVAVMARSDDVINVAGHRLSSGSLEEAVLEHDDIAEAAVVGLPDQLKGHVPVGFCVVKSDVDLSRSDEIAKEVIAKVREQVGPVACFKYVVIVPKLPKTRSGKIARNTLAAIVAGQPYKIPVTIEDATVYPEIEKAFQKLTNKA